MTLDGGSYLIGGNGGRGVFLVRTERDPSLSTEVVLLDPAFPSQFVMEAPYPNPFNGSVRLQYYLPLPFQTSVRIYDQLGHQVAELYDGRLEIGPHSMSWNAAELPTGAYLCRFEAGGIHRTAKLMLIR